MDAWSEQYHCWETTWHRLRWNLQEIFSLSVSSNLNNLHILCIIRSPCWGWTKEFSMLWLFYTYSDRCLDLLLLKKAHILMTCILLIYDRRNRALVKELSVPEQGTKDLYFPTQYSQPFFEQLRACLWKQWWTYWRSPDYNCVRYSFTFISAILFGTIFWNLGHKTYARLPSSSLIILNMFRSSGKLLSKRINYCQILSGVPRPDIFHVWTS